MRKLLVSLKLGEGLKHFHPLPPPTARPEPVTEARTNSDVAVRRQVLELWAEQPNQHLDPVTYALVDEDDTIRTRAQELYEQQLAREASTAPPTPRDTER